MKKYIFPSIKLSIVFLILFSVIYPALIWITAQAAPNHGKGETLKIKGKVVGYANEGQNFTEEKYFWSRPSAVGYNAAGSGGSNKGPFDAAYLQIVKDRLDTFMVHHPAIQKNQVPVEMITASGSGLDPDISLESALIQVERIAKIRNIPADKIRRLVYKENKKPLLYFLGPSHINVLKLNIELNNLN